MDCFSILMENKSDIVPIHKKGDKHILNSYRSVSLLLFVGKFLED